MVNYSKGLVYKLCCNDTNIKDIYVGSTTNFIRRKSDHKSACDNEMVKSIIDMCINSCKIMAGSINCQ